MSEQKKGTATISPPQFTYKRSQEELRADIEQAKTEQQRILQQLAATSPEYRELNGYIRALVGLLDDASPPES